MLHYVTFIFVLFVLIYKNDKQKHITTYHVTRMKTYICICYLNVLIAVLFTWCVFGCACVLLPRSHKRGMIVVKLMPNCGKINMFKPTSFREVLIKIHTILLNVRWQWANVFLSVQWQKVSVGWAIDDPVHRSTYASPQWVKTFV